MEMTELLDLIRRGEDSTLQYKEKINHIDSLVAEMAAMSNYRGGIILVGVGEKEDNKGTIIGISPGEHHQLNQWISNGAQNNVNPPILPQTASIPVADDLVVVAITVPHSDNKPHFDKNGIIWIKVGADKRKVGSREEICRLFQESELIHADAVSISAARIDELSVDKLRGILIAKHGEFEAEKLLGELPFPQLLENFELVRNGAPTIGGLLLIGSRPQRRVPAFLIRAISWVGNDPTGTRYRDSENIEGTLAEAYEKAMAFLGRQLAKTQAGQGFNSEGRWEVSREALVELVVNALIHRDYFISDSIKLWVFDDRIEIISPGLLPNNLTVEKVRFGNSNMRNPILGSFAIYVLPYRGAGTGVRRAVRDCPEIQLINDENLNAFRVVIPRSTAEMRGS